MGGNDLPSRQFNRANDRDEACVWQIPPYLSTQRYRSPPVPMPTPGATWIWLTEAIGS